MSFMDNKINIKSIIGKEERESIYKVFFIGLSAYNRILTENRELVKSNAFSEIRSKLLGTVLKIQLEDQMLSLDFPYEIEFKKVSNFGNIAAFLKDDRCKIQFNKIPKSNKLYNSDKPSKYMIREAVANSIYDDTYENQLCFSFGDVNGGQNIKNKYNKVYVILGYRVVGGDLEYLSFNIPDKNMKKSIDYLDVINEYNDMISGNNNEVYEEQIITIKKETEKIIKIK